MNLTRRRFLEIASGAAVAGLGFPLGAAPVVKRPSANGRLNLAVIGCGTQAHTNVPMFLRDPRVRVVTVCDPVLAATGYSYDAKASGGRKVFKELVDAHYADASCKMTADWREVVADPSVDAVLITTPDHWHAPISIAAMKAGKHVYCQKPMTLGIAEGQAMVRLAKASGVTFQVGSQHRGNSAFRVAAEFVRNGLLGECKTCTVGLPGATGGPWGHGRSRARQKAPAYFDTPASWNLWLGPSRHWEDDAYIPGIHEPMCWRWNSRTGGGMITDWGAHWIDILHWAFDVERTGPVAIENMTTNLGDDDVFDWADKYSFDLVYANGCRAHVSSEARCGLTFHGSQGDCFCFPGTLERPKALAKWNEKRDLKDTDVRLYQAKENHCHESDFVDGIFENRAIATDCEIGHRSISACHLANICERLHLSNAKWDPKAERFVDNAEADKLLETPHLNGFTL